MEMDELEIKLKVAKRESKAYRKALVDLSNAVLTFIPQMDAIFEAWDKAKWDGENGKAAATLMNRLNYANDSTRYFSLGVDFHNDKRKPVK